MRFRQRTRANFTTIIKQHAHARKHVVREITPKPIAQFAAMVTAEAALAITISGGLIASLASEVYRGIVHVVVAIALFVLRLRSLDCCRRSLQSRQVKSRDMGWEKIGRFCTRCTT